LLALLYAVVPSVNNIQINPLCARGRLTGRRLLDLVIVIVVSQGEQEAEFFHAEKQFLS
jgi:hypothetical protein